MLTTEQLEAIESKHNRLCDAKSEESGHGDNPRAWICIAFDLVAHCRELGARLSRVLGAGQALADWIREEHAPDCPRVRRSKECTCGVSDMLESYQGAVAAPTRAEGGE